MYQALRGEEGRAKTTRAPMAAAHTAIALCHPQRRVKGSLCLGLRHGGAAAGNSGKCQQLCVLRM